MGREIGATPEGAFKVPIIREESANIRPSISEVTGGPSALEGLQALGENFHRVAGPTIDRVLSTLNKERRRQTAELDHQEVGGINLAQLENTKADIVAGEEGFAELGGHGDILKTRTDGRAAIIAEIEEMGAEL